MHMINRNTQIFRFLDALNNCLAQNGTFFFLEKFSDACHVNSCFRYHQYYSALHEDNVKNFAIFCYDYFEDFLASITFGKNFGFLSGVASKKAYSLIKIRLQQTATIINNYDCEILNEIFTIKKSIFAYA